MPRMRTCPWLDRTRPSPVWRRVRRHRRWSSAWRARNPRRSGHRGSRSDRARPSRAVHRSSPLSPEGACTSPRSVRYRSVRGRACTVDMYCAAAGCASVCRWTIGWTWRVPLGSGPRSAHTAPCSTPCSPPLAHHNLPLSPGVRHPGAPHPSATNLISNKHKVNTIEYIPP